MIFSFVPPRIPGQLKTCYSCGLEGGQTSVSALLCFCVCYTKIHVEGDLKPTGHNYMVAELKMNILLPNPHHRSTSSKGCKHLKISSVCMGLFPRPDFPIHCFGLMKLKKSIHINNKNENKTEPTLITSRPNILSSLG